MDSPGWSGGFNKDVSSWLNARGWQDEPPPPLPIKEALKVESLEQRRAREANEAKERTRRELERETAMTDKVLNDKYGGWR
jgi:hypothetical protein